MGEPAIVLGLDEFKRRFGDAAEGLLQAAEGHPLEVALPNGGRLRLVVSKVGEATTGLPGRRPTQRVLRPEELSDEWVEALDALRAPGALDHLPK